MDGAGGNWGPWVEGGAKAGPHLNVAQLNRLDEVDLNSGLTDVHECMRGDQMSAMDLKGRRSY